MESPSRTETTEPENSCASIGLAKRSETTVAQTMSMTRMLPGFGVCRQPCKGVQIPLM